MRRTLPFLLLLAAVLPQPSGAATCGGGRFLVQDSPIIGAVSTPTEDAIVVDGVQVSLEAGVGTCSPATGKLKRTKNGLNVRVRWPACPGITGAVRIKAHIDKACGAMKGMVSAGKPRRHKPFVARLSRCGDGIVDLGAGEGCEPPDTASCNSDCEEVDCGDHCTCPAGRTSCNGKCVNLQTDSLNCGRCTARCSAAQHSKPICSVGKCSSVCESADFKDCNGIAEDGCEAALLIDPLNCGECGHECPGGPNAAPACIDGQCALKCDNGFGDCNTTVDDGCETAVDTIDHCGRCDRECPSGENVVAPLCTGGTCSVQCPTELFTTACGRNCVNIDSDARYCGGCGHPCLTGESCVTGQCVCPAPRVECPSACADLMSDALNCGGCGHHCGLGEYCSDGQCTCQPDRKSCSGQCINPDTDNKNCGGCGRLCGSGETCSAGRCVCAEGNRECSGTCVNTDTDARNCGQCGNVCESNTICQNGKCVCEPSPPKRVCSGACVDLDNSTANCGRCGNICEGAALCIGGACKCPSPLRKKCSGVCVNLQTDRRNCGNCGKTCGSGEICLGGHCR